VGRDIIPPKLKRGLTMSELTPITDETFQAEVLSASMPVLVDFGAAWCGPCKMLDPIVHQLADEWQGKVKFVKMDVDQNPNTPMKYQIMGVPTLILFINGEMKQRLSGYMSKDKLIAKLSPHL
jgi:thioredoxin 1